MPTAQIKLGSATIALGASGDLSSLATRPIVMKIIADAFDSDAVLNTPVGVIPPFSVQPQVEFTDTGTWKVAGQSNPLTLSVDAGSSGSLALIRAAAPLFQYPQNADGSVGQLQVARKGDLDCPYLRISLNVKYTVEGGENFSFGTLGVSATASLGRVFTVDNYFPCDPAMPFRDAIVAAFNSFVLPFNPQSAASMTDGAFVDYVFSGKMAFSAGVNYSLSLGAASLAQLKRSFDSTLVTGGIAPSASPGSSLDVKFEADDAFRIIIGRQHTTSQNRINLCVGKVDKKVFGLDFVAGLSAGLGAQFNLQDTVGKVIGTAAESILSRFSDDVRAKATDGLKKALGQDAVSKYIQDVQSKIDGFLQKVNTQKTEFAVGYEKARTNTQLFNYIINCDVPAALNAGYPAAISCDFLTAMRSAGVDLQPGSFLDDELSSKTTIKFQFFNIFETEDVTEFFRDLKTVYAGSGIFRLIFDTGVDWHSVFNGRSEDLKVFFEAESETGDQVNFQNATITLNFVMTDNKDAKRAGLTAKVLRVLNSPELSALADNITDTVQVTAKIHQEAFHNLKFDDVRIGNRLNPGAHDNDKRNYETFVTNVDLIRPDDAFGRGLRHYEHWVTFNRSANDQDGSSQPPDRANSGNLNTWPQQFIGISETVRRFIAIDFEAARQFMNLCEFLDRLGDEKFDAGMTKQVFNQLLDSLNSAIHNSPTALTWYSKASFSALAQLMSAKVINVTGPVHPGDPIDISFDLQSQTSMSVSTKT